MAGCFKISSLHLLFYIKHKKKDGIYFIVEWMCFLIVSIIIYLFLYMLGSNQALFAAGGGYLYGDNGKEQLLQITEKGLALLAMACMSVAAYSSVALQGFRVMRERRCHAILKAVGMTKEDGFIFYLLDVFIISMSASLIGMAISRYIFTYLVSHVLEMDFKELIIVSNGLYSFAKVFLLLFCLMFICRYVSLQKEDSLTVMAALRQQGEPARMNVALYAFLFACYILVVCLIFQEIQFILIGVLILFFTVCLIYKSMVSCLTALERYTLKFFLKNKMKKSIGSLCMRMMGNRKKKNAVLLTILSFCMLLMYLLLSIEWAMEGILENYWKKTQHFNVAIVTDISKERAVEEELGKGDFAYDKLYLKLFLSEKEGYILAVSAVTDVESVFYMEPGKMRSIPYDMHVWGIEKGDTYQLQDVSLTVAEPIPEYPLNLISYQVLVNIKSWEGKIDGSYMAVYLMLANVKGKEKLQNIADGCQAEFQDSRVFAGLVKELFMGYIKLLQFMLIMLFTLILFFVFSAVLTSIIPRDKEFYIYWGCGAGKKQIKQLILLEYFYMSIVGVSVSALLFMLIINMVQRMFFQEMAFFRLPFFILLFMTVFLICFVLSIVIMVVKFFCKMEPYEMFRRME